jgi:hypothetical protein
MTATNIHQAWASEDYLWDPHISTYVSGKAMKLSLRATTVVNENPARTSSCGDVRRTRITSHGQIIALLLC